MELFGVDRFLDNLERLDQDVARQSNRVLKSSAKPLKEAIENKINYGPAKHYNVHAKDDVLVGRVRNDGFTKYVFIGFSDKTFFYMWFLEEGTSGGIEPRHYVRDALDETREQVAKLQEEGLRRIFARYS